MADEETTQKSPFLLDHLKALFKIKQKNAINEDAQIENSELKSIQIDEAVKSIQKSYVPQSSKEALNLDHIKSLLSGVGHNVQNKRIQNDIIRKLAPEVMQAEKIIVSSIISPNDLQSAPINITMKPTANVNEDAVKKIIKVLDDYFNNFLDFGTKQEEWLKDTMFRSGSHAIMLLPQHILIDIVKNGIVDEKEYEQMSSEAFTASYLYDDVKNRGYHSIDFSDRHKKYKVNINDAFSDISVYKKNKHAIDEGMKFFNNVLSNSEFLNISDRIEDIGVSFYTEQITQQQRDVNMHMAMESFINDKRDDSKREAILDFVEKRKNMKIPNELFVNLVASEPEKDTQEQFVGHPIFMELPSESIMPIFIPGAPQDHIGYFVLLDESGYPMTEFQNNAAMDPARMSYSLAQTADQAFRDKHNTNLDLASADKFFATNKESMFHVFDSVFTAYMKSHLYKVGKGRIDGDTMNSLSKCMFTRILKGKKTSIVYVPKDYITYYAFDYRTDGTGKSKLDDIEFILSLRVTLLVAYMMSSVKNATNETRVSINFDESCTNYSEIMGKFKEALVSKQKYDYPLDPMIAQNQIVDKNIVFEPKNIPGIENFEVSKTNNTNSYPKVDNDFFDIITNMLVTCLGVPYSALNQLSDTEYSRSVATTNLFFASNIRGYQKKFSKFNTRLIQKYIYYSKPLTQKIRDIITDSGSMSNESIDSVIYDVIMSVETYLQPANIAIDKATINIIEDVVRAGDTVAQQLYNDDFSSNDDDLRNVMSIIRAKAKSDFITGVLPTIGVGSNIDNFKNINEFNASDLAEVLMSLKNIASAQKKVVDSYKPESDDDSSSGGGGGWG